jgi:hypothetical protein
MPPLPSEAKPRPPEDFTGMLATPEPVLLVGGQAVNLWALYYKSRTADLAPFVSRDVDVLGDRETLELLGRIAGKKPQVFPMKPPSNEVGVVVAQAPDGTPLLVEVLRSVHGVTKEELLSPCYTMAIGSAQVKLPSPIALLQAKLANVADLSQTGRQDARHVLILARLMPAYLQDIQSAVLAGRLEERKFIEIMERLLAVVAAAQPKKVLKQLDRPITALFSGIGHEKLTKVQVFLRQRMPRVL